MDAQQLAEKLRDDIKHVQAQGAAAVDSQKLIDYLDAISKDANLKTVIEKDYDVRRKSFIRSIDHKQEWDIELFRATIAKGESALHTAFLMNGGATVAILALVGQLAVSKPNKVQSFSESILIFTGGVFFIVLSYGITYLSQYCYADQHWKKNGDLLRRIAVILALASYVFFLAGAFVTYCGFKSF